MPDEWRQDPIFHRTKGTDGFALGRDGCRVPMAWAKDGPSGSGPPRRRGSPNPRRMPRWPLTSRTASRVP